MAHVPTDEVRFISHSREETIEVGKQLGELVKPNDIFVLTGDLGAGKTQLTKGIAEGMGITADVTSPTFTIEMVYTGPNLSLYHFDLYRIDDADQLEDTGIFDVLGAGDVCVIEWGEQFSEELGEERIDVFLVRLESDQHDSDGQTSASQDELGVEPAREIRLVAHDARGEELLSALSEKLKKFSK